MVCQCNAMPYHYCEQLEKLGDHFQISASISNLLRLGLIISSPGVLKDGVPERIRNEPYVQNRFHAYNKLENGVTVDVPVDCDIISLDSYGRQFVDICMIRKVK